MFKNKKNIAINDAELVIPKHVAIIMDGNGRWAKEKGLARNLGHNEGAKRIVDVLEASKALGVKNLTVYAFSTENWKRPKKEVDHLMNMPKKFFKKYLPKFKENKVKLNFIGHLEQLPQDLQDIIKKSADETRHFNDFVLTIAINYGGRSELVAAAKKIAVDYKDNKLNLNELNEDKFEDYLMTNDLYPVDLLIKPGREKRISNYLLWQLAYSEMYFTDVLWPDFDKTEFNLAIYDYSKRKRRFGGLLEE